MEPWESHRIVIRSSSDRNQIVIRSQSDRNHLRHVHDTHSMLLGQLRYDDANGDVADSEVRECVRAISERLSHRDE